MKNRLSIIALVFCTSLTVFAQEEPKEKENKVQTDKGKWFIQTDFGNAFSSYRNAAPTTMFNYKTSDDYGLGLSGGYFLKKDFAITASIGYEHLRTSDAIRYNVGAKKYFRNHIFLSADVGAHHFNDSAPFLLSQDSDIFSVRTNIGYAWFIGKYISLEPSLGIQGNYGNRRPDYDLNLNLGFSIHF